MGSVVVGFNIPSTISKSKTKLITIFIKGPYGEPVSMNNTLPEKPVKLPCGHVFGDECILLSLRYVLFAPIYWMWSGVTDIT